MLVLQNGFSHWNSNLCHSLSLFSIVQQSNVYYISYYGAGLRSTVKYQQSVCKVLAVQQRSGMFQHLSLRK